jgi:hypothetical protein
MPVILDARLILYSSSTSASVETLAWTSFSRVLMILSRTVR